MPPATITATAVVRVEEEKAIRATADPIARKLRKGSGASLSHSFHTAKPTTGTATTTKPWIHPCARSPIRAAARPKEVRMTAEGRVNPSHAANPPRKPPRTIPTAKPSWELAAPGVAWERAKKSANVPSSTQRRRSTYSLWK